jgi:hypothetical protein
MKPSPKCGIFDDLNIKVFKTFEPIALPYLAMPRTGNLKI